MLLGTTVSFWHQIITLYRYSLFYIVLPLDVSLVSIDIIEFKLTMRVIIHYRLTGSVFKGSNLAEENIYRHNQPKDDRNTTQIAITSKEDAANHRGPSMSLLDELSSYREASVYLSKVETETATSCSRSTIVEMQLSSKCLLLGLSAKHSPVDDKRTESQHNKEDDAEHQDNTGVSAGPIVSSFQELVGVLVIVDFADNSHREWCG